MVVGGGTQPSSETEGESGVEGESARGIEADGRVGRRNAGWKREEKRSDMEGGGRSYESGAAVFVSPSYGHHVRQD